MTGITYYRDKCIGCRACVEHAGERWRMSQKDGKAVLIGGKLKNKIFFCLVREDEYDANRKAAQNCPVNSIILNKAK
ncbi:MAG: ferredoxin [Saprospiraceae bacterium]|nr:ferredoxin [Saprospiraceae bacterium]MCF8249020.1 ferredoxin [Saprospiraceae bacterium]MCF8282422.1 ferredoxin [Bacteroidales bacterium]MCF8310914.1 ferredoxin [Saprospiraceae bacterium]MCF8439498.1 ferredoxin [Saprospiraceae bacterium]